MSPAASEGTRSPEFVRELARRQLRDSRRLDPGTFFAEEAASLTLDEAYAVQDEIRRLRVAAGDAVVGYKIGCVGPRIRETFGMSGPIRALLFRGELRESGTRLSAARFANLAIEGEIALRIGAEGEIVEALAVIELHHYVFRGARKTLAELIANNGLNAGVVLPPRGTGRPHVPTDGEMSVEIDGARIETGPFWAMPGGARAARDWLSSHLAEHGTALRSGDLILVGTPLGLHRVGAGARVRVSATGLAPVEIDVVA